MLTAAVRDLHRWYPNEFLTDARTSCTELWDNNPYLTRLEATDERVESIECHYPLINTCNQEPYHCLHGFAQHLSATLGLQITPTEFRGDIHISRDEKRWASQVQEISKTDLPFWIIDAGGKYDITIKWWSTERYQKIIDDFQGRILFVQIGQNEHHHPALNGVLDLRGKTTMREFVRLIYHSEGVLCPVTAAMHLAAAVGMKGRPGMNRPCVVIAGGREPAHWEAYPDHQFISTNGTLPCCLDGGCWRDRTLPLGDGDERDHPERLCTNVVGSLPRCMDMITADEVIRRIELFYQGGVLSYLTNTQRQTVREITSSVTAATNADIPTERFQLKPC